MRVLELIKLNSKQEKRENLMQVASQSAIFDDTE